MTSLHFLCKVISLEKDNTYKVLVNLDNNNELPAGNVGEKLVHSISSMKKNDIIYVYDAVLDDSTRKVTINKFTVISASEIIGQEIPAELLSLANLSEVTPFDMMNEVYSIEPEEEDDDDEESKLQDTEVEE